jgi:hypothetical protein
LILADIVADGPQEQAQGQLPRAIVDDEHDPGDTEERLCDPKISFYLHLVIPPKIPMLEITTPIQSNPP